MEIIKINKNSSSGCPYFPYGYYECFYKHCDRCDLADRLRDNSIRKNNKYPLFIYSDARRQTVKGGGAYWWHFPIILSEDVMNRLNIYSNMFYQIAIVDGGPGVFANNVSGEIDIHLFADESKKFTISRLEAYGIPNDKAIRRYDECFFMNLKKAYQRACTLSDEINGKWHL